MRPIDQPPLCGVDPISLTGLALGALGSIGGAAAGGAFSGGGSGSSSTTAPAAPAAAPTQLAQPVSQPQGTKPTPKSQAPTFLGAAAVPQSGQSGTKTLLGQ